MEILPLYKVFFDNRERCIYKSPSLVTPISYIDYSHEFVVSALVRFEHSTCPDHIGTRTVVLRFLKIITSVKCVDGFICYPKEGSFTGDLENIRLKWIRVSHSGVSILTDQKVL